MTCEFKSGGRSSRVADLSSCTITATDQSDQMMKCILPSCLIVLLAAAGTAESQTIRGSIVDRDSRERLTGVSIILLDGEGKQVASTVARTGLFRIELDVGTYELRAERAGYKAWAEYFSLTRPDSLYAITIEMLPETVILDTVRADVRRPWMEPIGVMQHTSHIVAGERLAELEKAAASTLSVVTGFSGLRRRGTSRIPCFESARSIIDLEDATACRMVVIILDGVRAGSEVLLQPLSSFESVEYLPPSDAGTRYGMEASARGAIVFHTRGFGPRRSPARGAGGDER